MRNQQRLEFKVGLFINLGLALLVISVLVLGSSHNLLVRKNHYTILLPNAGRLLSGARVLLAGIPVGTVQGFDLGVRPHLVSVSLSIASKYERYIRTDTFAEVVTEGLVGDRVVSLNPGAPANEQIAPGGEIPVKESFDLNGVVGKGDELLRNLNSLARDVGGLVREYSSGANSHKISRVLDQLGRILNKVDRGSGTLSALLNDPELYDDAKALVGETNENRVLRNLVRKAVQDSEKNRAPASGRAGCEAK